MKKLGAGKPLGACLRPPPAEGGSVPLPRPALGGAHGDAGAHPGQAAAKKKALEINTNFTLTAYANFMPYKNRVDEEQDVGDMRKAGLPD